MFFSGQGDTCCSVTPLPRKENRDDRSFATEMFSMEIAVSSLVIPPQHIAEADSDNDDDSWVYEADCKIEEKTFLVERRGLISPAVAGFLEDMGIPRGDGRDFMVAKIMRSARWMEHCNPSRKVLHLRVSIDLSPGEPMNDDDDDDDSEDEDDDPEDEDDDSENEGSCLTC